MLVNRNIFIGGCWWLTLLACACFGQEKEITVKIQHEAKTLYGLPLAWNGTKIALLRQDGQLSFVPAASKDDAEVVATYFKPYTSAQLKSQLEKKFGKRYDVSVTPNFVVVHPWGKSKIWADPFEDFSQRFQQFFSDKGIALAKPRFFQVAIVLRSRSDFDRLMSKDELEYDRAVGGYYSRLTNRMTTYDPSQLLRTEDESWLYSSPTVIHESAHQLAFNFGLHNRFASPPLWLSEGLAMLFEARGVNHAAKYPDVNDRLNPRRFIALKKYHEEKQITGKLSKLVENDKMFQTDREFAYALSWGITFFLSETNPEAYFDFLRRDGERKDFAPYPPEMRLEDFVKAFGSDFEQLEKDMSTFLFGESADKETKKSE